MSGGDANFTSQELAIVLSQYDIGNIKQVDSLNVGNTKAPKKIITSNKGKFLLKRRARGKDDIYHVAFAHAVQIHLQEKDFAVAHLVPTADKKSTALNLENHVYELFHFVEGSRYDGSSEQTTDAGRYLAKFHLHLADFDCNFMPLRSTFHDSSSVRGHLKFLASEKAGAPPNIDMRQTSERLMTYYNRSSVEVNQLGFDSWPEQIVHGDWHPGNMLFASQKVAAVLDFDSARTSPAVTDLANGALQFSIVAGRPNPADWPAYLDRKKLLDFLAGYREITNINSDMLRALPDLMTETMIAEAVRPIATTGFFFHLSGFDFMKMIRRKCEWISQNRQELKKAISN